ncbi:hypothetical protein FIBSPDRAFT_926716 [Athelia psychrophila]|uniref:Fatty acid desaturase domain-containing protein n=1 Tax=Athelia psychrophila TaxID=1759441 RepID=A0A166SUF6_9AGAM|nr:hypothetical protein FIBSPDRAFT_926716 [Fibularhizoctonia sp. CBS 109695]
MLVVMCWLGQVALTSWAADNILLHADHHSSSQLPCTKAHNPIIPSHRDPALRLGTPTTIAGLSTMPAMMFMLRQVALTLWAAETMSHDPSRQPRPQPFSPYPNPQPYTSNPGSQSQTWNTNNNSGSVNNAGGSVRAERGSQTIYRNQTPQQQALGQGKPFRRS